jgi:putative oxidoreductase
MPLAGAALIGTMITAIRTVHWKHGVWVTKGGYEYNVVLIAVIAALIEAGPGAPSLGRERKGPGWALLALGAGAAGSFAVTELAKRQPLPEASPVGG